MSLSVAEERIRRLMARLSASEHRAAVVQDRILRTRQDLAGFYQVGAGRGCVTTIVGMIVGGQEFTPMPNTKLKVVGHQTATIYGTFDLPTGEYSIELTLDPADTQLEFSTLGPVSPRFSTTFGITSGVSYLPYLVFPTDDSEASIVPCAANAIPRLKPPVPANTFYITGPSTGGLGQVGYLYPIYRGPIQVSVSDSVWGVSYASTCELRDTYATDLYPAVNDVPSYFTYGGGIASAAYQPVSSFNHAPATGTCPISGGGWSVTCGEQTDITSETHPGVDFSTLWQITWNCSDQMFHNGGPATLQFYEDPP